MKTNQSIRATTVAKVTQALEKRYGKHAVSSPQKPNDSGAHKHVCDKGTKSPKPVLDPYRAVDMGRARAVAQHIIR